MVIPQDSYYKDSSYLPLEDRQKINFDHPEAIDFKLLCKQLKELKEGKRIEQPVYSYLTCSRSTTETVTVEPADVIIIEGILVFTCKELREQMDIKIFVDADDDDRLMRVMARDIIERGKTVETVIERYTKTVKPMYLQFIEHHRVEAGGHLGGGEGRVEAGRGDVAPFKRGHLVRHQRDERRDDERRAGEHERRKLVAEGLAGTGGHHDDGVATGEDLGDGLILAVPEVVVAEMAPERRVDVLFRYHARTF